MGINTERVLEILEAGEQLSNVSSLDQNPGVWEGQSGQSFCGADAQVNLIMMKEQITALREKERLVILMRYFRDMTQQQIADRLGVSQVQVSRIEKQALGKIREQMMVK